MITCNQLIDWGVPIDIGDFIQYHDRSGMSDQEEKLTTKLQVHSRVSPISDSNDIVSHVYPNPSDDVPDDEKCLNIPQDCMTHDISRDLIRYNSTQRIFEVSGENIMGTWPIVNTTTAHMEGAQD